MSQSTTIAAVATPLFAAAIGVIRVSGPQARQIAAGVFRSPNGRSPLTMRGFTAAYGGIYSGDELLDNAVLTVYRAPHSYTGEDTVELSCHGGVLVLERVLHALIAAGARMAEPGEFSRRAFLNGKLTLSQAEGVMNLISAGGVGAARAALAGIGGVLSREVDTITEQLLDLSAHMAAWADYPEDDIPELEPDVLLRSLNAATAQLDSLIAGYAPAALVREGVSTAIVGRPNVGKSTLMNLLARAERSIVTDTPGTTRDVVESAVRLSDNVTLLLADTAGLRETGDEVESIGVRMAHERIEHSALVLAVFDSSQPLTEQDRELLARLKGRRAIAVLNKSDLSPQLSLSDLTGFIPSAVAISAKEGEGLAELVAAIERELKLDTFDAAAPALASARQYSAALDARQCIQEASAALAGGVTLDAVGVLLEQALEALLALSGRRAGESIVDRVFENFCLGK